MNQRSALLIGILFTITIQVHAQTRKVLFEEVNNRPDTIIGQWVIGNKNMIVDSNSQIASAAQIKPGSLAVTEYFEVGSKTYVTRMQPYPAQASEINDGPYVNWIDAKTAEIITIVKGKVSRQRIQELTQPRVIEQLTPRVKSLTLDPAPPSSPKSEWEQPSRLMAISDLEGNYLNAVRFLENNKVIDNQGRWIWGDGHLVLVGDLVDRGKSVTELMWLIHRLENEAIKAGGRVHYVLGNHEAMVMGGDLRYIHPKYLFTSTRIGITYDQLHGPNTEIGRWWRSKNGVTRVGDLLFVHGGYSPKLDAAKLEIEQLNRLIRNGLPPRKTAGTTPATNPVGDMHGPFWYRGYFPQHAAAWGGLATPDQLKQILNRHNAKHVVIGHTVVDQVGPIDESGFVLGIDVKWADPEKCEGLLQEKGVLYRVLMNGQRQRLFPANRK
ncbi:MAG: metallophosphoesterase [Mariniblastus sp.]|nr:metallophosphoesterase [Mariniblastus sp.]